MPDAGPSAGLGTARDGKTVVLRRAISDLLRAGKRVLLVSSTNVAVDNALAGVLDELKPSPGFLVRVGLNTREVMVEHEGQWFAAKLLQHEHAEYFANPPQCGDCEATAELHRSSRDDTGPLWSWRCGVRTCRWTQDASPPEPSGRRVA